MRNDCLAFGTRLIATRDLDPVYVAIKGAKLSADQAERLLMSYFCFYDLGTAAFLSDYKGDAYWAWMQTAAANTEPTPYGGRWPRQPERRHFRGAKCEAAIHFLSARPAEEWVRDLWFDGCTEENVMTSIRGWPLFGPWIGFKAADMLERCLGWPVRFSRDIGLIYDAPRAGLDLLSTLEPKSQEHHYHRLLAAFATTPAPPDGKRMCGPQEVETVLCKFHSYHAGRYWVGKDIHEEGPLLGLGTNARRPAAY